MWKEKIAGALHYFLEKKDVENVDPWNLYTGSADFSDRSRAWVNNKLWIDTGEKIDNCTIKSFDLAWRGLGQHVVLPPGTYTLSAFVEGAKVIFYSFAHNIATEGDATIKGNGLELGDVPEMKRISCTFEVVKGGLAYPRFESKIDSPFKIAGLMLNKGSMALPWNYAKADFDDRFANIESQIIGGGY